MWRRKWLLLMAGAGGGPTSRIRALHCFHSLCFPRRIQHHCSFVHFLRAFLWFHRYLERLWVSLSSFWEWVEGNGPNIHLVIRSGDTTFLKSSSELIQFDENLWSYTAHQVKWIILFIFKTKRKLITVSTFWYKSGNNIGHRTNFHWFYINHIFSIKESNLLQYPKKSNDLRIRMNDLVEGIWVICLWNRPLMIAARSLEGVVGSLQWPGPSVRWSHHTDSRHTHYL